MTQSIKLGACCILFLGGLVASSHAQAAAYKTTITNQIYSPALKIDPRTWLVKIVTITGIPKSPGLVIQIPCLTSDPSAGELQHGDVASRSYADYWCVPQAIPTGYYKGAFLEQHGQILAKPPQ
jgi:hypothetical protein